ncbi:MAG: enoyl-CoA hydratase/isomerase family protein [Hyphomicrobium sp.]|jgi:enoyl-CoA hydratase
MADGQTQDLLVENTGALLLVTLNRPRALNALTAGMRTRLAEALWAAARDAQIYAVVMQSASERAFSAGSDVREVILAAREDKSRASKFFADEYALNWQCECFSKPTVPLIDGMVMGGGVGITLYGTHRVAGEGYRFAMPETLIGLFPDVGVCHAFARMPGHMGQYLGLTGRTIGRADAYALGLVTHCIGAEHFATIKTELSEAWPVDTILDRLHVEPEAGELAALAGTIETCFSADSVEEILERLGAVQGAAQPWAQEVIADLGRRSPLSLKITQRHVREAAARDLRQTLMIDGRLAARVLDDHDFYEGVRAALIDKDHSPRWRPETLSDVTDAMLDAYFVAASDAGPVLPTRGEMQAQRA